MCAKLALAAVAGWSIAISGAAQTHSSAHPDFSGIWYPARGRDWPNSPPYTEAAKKLREEYEAAFTPADDPGRYCIWPGMPRAPWGVIFPVEIIHRDQDVTMYWEGYGMYRKIYMAEHAPPPPPVPSAMGYSVAHWEDDALIVETTHLKAYPYMTRLATTSDAHVLERITLVEREEDGERHRYLVDEITLTDPKLYEQPVRMRVEAQYRPDIQMLEYTCTDALWDEYLQQRGLSLPDVDALPEPTED